MKVEFRASFARDLRVIADTALRARVKTIIGPRSRQNVSIRSRTSDTYMLAASIIVFE